MTKGTESNVKVNTSRTQVAQDKARPRAEEARDLRPVK